MPRCADRKPRSASAASITASAANAAGTEDYGRIRARRVNGVGHGVEYRPSFVRRASLPGVDAADNSVPYACACWRGRALFAGEPLND